MRRFFTLIVPATLLAVLFTSYMGITKISASTFKAQVPHVTCTGDGCDGLDPVATGCAHDAITVKTTGGTTTFRTGTIELRYSPTCGTNWGRVVSSVGSAQLTVSIRRETDGLFYFKVSTGTILWSPMVFAKTVKAKACGSAGHFEDCTEGI